MTAAADPAEPAPEGEPPARWSRRWFLAGGAAIVVGGGVGVGVGFLRHESHPAPNPPPAALLDAVAAERELLALATAAQDASLQPVLAVLRADHRAHLRALQSALSGYDRPPTRPTPTPSRAVPGRTQLRARERAAGAAAAARAQRLTGAQAALLASIAACEATHAEVLA